MGQAFELGELCGGTAGRETGRGDFGSSVEPGASDALACAGLWAVFAESVWSAGFRSCSEGEYYEAGQGAEVELFLQHDSTPLAVGSAHQASVTKQAVKNLIDWVDKAQPNAEALKISLYKPPASLGAVIIDDAYIVLSLYLYKPLAGAVKKQSPKDTVMLKGHTVFAFLLKGGTPEFNLLKPLIEEHIKDIKTESIEYIETP